VTGWQQRDLFRHVALRWLLSSPVQGLP